LCVTWRSRHFERRLRHQLDRHVPVGESVAPSQTLLVAPSPILRMMSLADPALPCNGRFAHWIPA
jgi:hypothetical protein